MSNLDVRPLPALNDNYDPPRPWVCATHAAHECDGKVVGALGAYPVCLEGAVAERAARRAEAERRARLMADPEFQARLREEARIERWIETR
jgi:hypothetical protein